MIHHQQEGVGLVRVNRKLFTMMEMLAVLVITSILVAMTIGIFKTDSTTTNAQIISGAIIRAKSHAMSNTTQVRVTFNSDNVLVEYEDDPISASGTFDKILKNFKLSSGGTVSSSTSPIIFKTSGEPDFTTQQTVTISNNKGGVPDLIIYIKPFTGKVTFYQ